MKKIAIGLIGLLGLIGPLKAQSPFSFDWHGFVNPHYYADSRSVVGGREDMMLFYPKPIVRDSLGNDLNDGWQADMLAITARLNLRISGPDMLGAKTFAFVEGDFTGATNATIDNLRLRHAYIQMDWNLSHLIVGQYWYAMVVHEIMPMTNPLNMGAPFHCYARQPQVRYEYRHGGFEGVAVASWQLDNMSQGLLDGVKTSSTQFARHSMVPELNAQLRYRVKNIFIGAAANLKTIQPIVPDPTGTLHTSFSWSLFGKATLGPVTVKVQTLLNNSLYEGCSLGGYLIIPGADGHNTIRDWHFNTVWLDVERNRGHWRPGLFMGYAKRGTIIKPTEDLMSTPYIFGRGDLIRYLWRVQPRLTYTTGGPLSLTGEVEYTKACYIENTGDSPVANLRLSLSMVYSF